MGKVDFHNTGKVWENKHFKFMGFLNISGKAEIYTIPKIWEKWIPLIRVRYGENKHSKVTGFLKISGEAGIYTIPKIWEQWIYFITGKVWENTEIFHTLRYLADVELMRTHAIPNVWECTNSDKMDIFFGKPYHSEAVGFWGN